MNRRGFLGALLAAPAAAVVALKAVPERILATSFIARMPWSVTHLSEALKRHYSRDFYFAPYQTALAPLLEPLPEVRSSGDALRFEGRRFHQGGRIANRHDARRGRVRVRT